LRSFSNRLIILSVIILLFISFSNTHFPVSGVITTQTFWETDLNPDGYAYEINSGLDGTLWISDYSAGEIRAYQPSSNLMTIYADLGLVSDARPDGEGNVWFIDQGTDRLGKLNPFTGELLYWQLGTNISPFGTTIDPQNRIWVSLTNNSNLYLLTPGEEDEGVLCTLDLIESGFNGSYYVVDESGTVWLGGNTQVYRLIEVSESQYQLVKYTPSGSMAFSAEGLLGDGDGGLWFADSSTNKAIVHLDVTSGGSFNQFAIPRGIPYMLTRQNDLIWFSGQEPGVLGSLDPFNLTPNVNFVNISESTLEPACDAITATTGIATKTSETPIWVESSYPIETTIGWSVIDFGEDSHPWGIVITGGSLWMVDQDKDHKVLMRSDVEATITACKFSDADGELKTVEDREAIAGWQMKLFKNNVLIGTQTTAIDGCATWSNLPLGVAYTIEEEQRDGWVALEPANGVCDLGTFTQVRQYTCDFINWKEESNIFLPLVIK
jgi:hypothetical protein